MAQFTRPHPLDYYVWGNAGVRALKMQDVKMQDMKTHDIKTLYILVLLCAGHGGSPNDRGEIFGKVT